MLKIKTDIRTCGINPNHWYVVATSKEVTNKPLGVTLWKQNIVLYRDSQGKINALEDFCPHRRVKLSEGVIIGDDIECAYHGWRFNANGHCSFIPYLTSGQKLPKCQIASIKVQELNGFIWVLSSSISPSTEKSLENNTDVDILPLPIPEWNDLNYITSVATIDCPGHFSFLIENLMDMYHGHLHNDYQAWAEASLQELTANENQVTALYQAQSYYRIDKIWSISQLFFPALRRLHPEPLTVQYAYPHWVSSLGDDFRIYCLFCPIDETHTRAYLIHFTSLNAFWRLHKLPIWFRRFIKNSLFGAAKGLLDGLVRQDVKMIEQEQQAYLSNTNVRTYELNPAIAKVQQLIINQSQNN